MDLTRDLAVYVAFPCTLKTPAYGAGQPYVADSAAKAAYVDAVAAELAALDDELRARPVTAVRLGGGASIMKADKVCKLVRDVRKTLNVKPRAEVSIEVNPLTVCTPSLTDWTSCHVTRVNLVVESVFDDELKALGASHTRDDIQNAMLFLQKFHVGRVDARLRYGLPGQTSSSWRKSLLTVADLGVAHITVRPLVEADAAKASGLPSREERRAMYDLACEVLGKAGYTEYLVGMFTSKDAPHAQDGYETALRRGADRLALGAGASSSYDGFLYENASGFEAYLQSSADFAALVRNPRREGDDARQVRLMEGALDLLGSTAAAVTAGEGASASLEPAAQAWLDGLASAGRVEPAADGGWRLTGLGRFERNEELGAAVAL